MCIYIYIYIHTLILYHIINSSSNNTHKHNHTHNHDSHDGGCLDRAVDKGSHAARQKRSNVHVETSALIRRALSMGFDAPLLTNP